MLRKYFENSPSAKYKTPEEFKKQEIRLFEEILNERIESLESDIAVLSHSEKKKEKQTGLFGAELNIEAKSIQKEKKDLQEIEERIKECEDEITKLKNVKKILHEPDKKPFVWDIDFAEVFSDKGGFDIVIGNPPYVRQEKIAPPNKLKEEITLEDRQEYKQKLINSVSNRFPVVTTWDKKSDLYIYFYYHGISLLNVSGVFCFITSNSWLDVGYGKGLQEFLLRYSHVIVIYDNQAKRSFEHADVNTIIALLGAPQFKKEKSLLDYGVEYNGNGKATYHGFNLTARFVMFKKPFEEVINTPNLILIEKADKILKTDEFRVYPINQEDLLEDGWEYPEEFDGKRFTAGNYEGNKWGGKYLRAPDIFYTILEKGKGKLVKLGDIARVRFGIKTGANDFFYLDEEAQKKWNIEKEFLKPVISSMSQIEKLVIRRNDAKTHLFSCMLPKKELEKADYKNALAYIEWGSKQLTKVKGKHTIANVPLPKAPSVESHSPEWYSIEPHKPGSFIVPRLIRERFFFADNPDGVSETDMFFHGYVNENPRAISAILNCSFTYLLLEIFGRQGIEGRFNIYGSELHQVVIIDSRKISKSSLKSLEKVMGNIGRRKIVRICEECGIDPSKPIREQEPKPLPDRAELDNIIFDELGLTKEERKEVYWAVCELVQQRLNKASSLKEK